MATMGRKGVMTVSASHSKNRKGFTVHPAAQEEHCQMGSSYLEFSLLTVKVVHHLPFFVGSRTVCHL